ncbi:hypothetical protein KEJ24_07270 [Candidatus Bathyarchaeota archaeon]|nr:hypothetical protein [Candidatus Bathyarchaeota archaeon]
MPARKMRIEIFDNEGNKYSIAFEGQITREKALRLLDLVELLGGVSNHSETYVPLSETSKYDQLLSVIQKHFPVSWFSSKDVQLAYEQEFKQPIGLSTVATYLSRMANKGLLIRSGASNRLKYRVSPNFSQVTVKQKMPRL